MIILLCVVTAFNYMDRMALAVLSPLIKADLGLTDAQLGLLVGLAFSLFYAVCGIPIGRIADRGDRRAIIALAVTVWSVMTALSGAAQNYWHLFLARVGVGAGEAGSVAPGASVLCDYVGVERRPMALAILAFGSSLGVLAGMAIAGWLGQIIGWRWTFVALGAPGIFVGLLVWTTLREPKRGAFDAMPAADTTPSLVETFKFLWSCRTYRWVILFLVANGFMNYGLTLWWPSFYARTFEMSIAPVGLALGIALGLFGGASVLVGGFVGSWALRRSPRLALQIAAVSNLISMPLAAATLFAPSFSVSIVLVALTSICWGMSGGPILAAQYSVVSTRMRATAGAMAVFITAVVGFGSGPWLVGAISDGLSPILGEAALRYAMLLPVSVIGVTVVALFLAAESLPKDLCPVGAGEGVQLKGAAAPA